jgi:hypothetical protein
MPPESPPGPAPEAVSTVDATASTAPASSTTGAAASGSGGAGVERRWLRRPRGLEWVIVGVAVFAAWKLWDWRGNVTAPGKPVDAPITLVTSDREDLACAYGGSVGHYRCELEAAGKPWPTPPPARDRLAPYFTTGRQMYLIPGLFEQPALAARYASERPGGVPREKLRRFVAHCQLRLVERIEHFQTRWLAGGNFNDSDSAWVAEPVSCQVTNE